MRSTRLLSLLLLAACGGSDSSDRPDAARPGDGSVTDSSGTVDGGGTDGSTTDAPPAGPGTSRVWVVGDYLVDNNVGAGAFLDSATAPATLPLGGATVPAVQVAGQTTEMPTPDAFDAVDTRTAFVADITVAGRFDLYAAGPAGESPVLLVQGGAPVDITSVALSPDGTKVAFTMDSATADGGYDAYVVSTTGTGTPVRVSPDRATVATPTDLDVVAVLRWSRDSTYLAFCGDLTENNFLQAYVVDTSAGTPTPVTLVARADIGAQTTGARGVGPDSVRFDATGNVYFRARLVTDAPYGMYKATPAGARTAYALPARGDASAPDASTFEFSPDGTKLVVQADSPTMGTYNLFVQTVGQATQTNLTNLATPGLIQHTSAIAFAPDGTKVAVVATYAIAERRNPYVINLDGSGMRRIARIPANLVSSDFDMVQWSVDGTAVYAVADYQANNDGRLYKLDPAMTDGAPTLAVTTPVTGDVFRVLVRPAQ